MVISASNKIYRINTSDLLLSFILLFPIADILTGFMIFRLGMPEAFLGSPSQIVRLVFLFVGLSQIPTRDFNKCCKLIIYFLIIESISFFYINNITPFISGINYSFKIIYIYIFYLWTDYCCRHSKSFYKKFVKIIIVSAVLYAFLGIIMPVALGISKASYSEGTFGQKGLLASGNALGIYMGIITALYTLKE